MPKELPIDENEETIPGAKEPSSITQQEFDHVIVRLENILDGFADTVEQRLSDVEKSIENTQKVNAVLITAYGEAASLLDALFDTVASSLDKEGEKELITKVETLRKSLFDTLNEQYGLDDADTGKFTAMANMDERSNPDQN